MNPKYHAKRRYLWDTKVANQRYQTCKLAPVILRSLWTVLLVAAPMAAKAQDVCTIRLEDGRIVPSADLSVPAFATGDIDPSVPVGTVLYLTQLRASGSRAGIKCSRTMGRTLHTVRADSQADFYGTFKTSIAGVGIRIRMLGNETWWPYTDFDNRMEGAYGSTQDLVMELVKTGPITARGYITGQIGEFRHIDFGHTYRRIYMEGSGIAVEPRVPTCKLTTPLVPVYLGGISVSDLMDSGKGPWKDFNLNLMCSGGNIGTTTRMFIVFSDTQNPANRSTTLSLSRDSSARNVGIEMQREDGQLVSFGPETGEINQWQVGEFENSLVNIKLKARYIWTSLAEAPTPGSANADATFVISYK